MSEKIHVGFKAVMTVFLFILITILYNIVDLSIKTHKLHQENEKNFEGIGTFIKTMNYNLDEEKRNLEEVKRLIEEIRIIIRENNAKKK